MQIKVNILDVSSERLMRNSFWSLNSRTTRYILQNDKHTAQWQMLSPVHSLDLNIVESVWNYMKKTLRQTKGDLRRLRSDAVQKRRQAGSNIDLTDLGF